MFRSIIDQNTQGVDRVVLYFKDHWTKWIGVSSIESVSDDELEASVYIDGQKRYGLYQLGDLEVVVSCYGYPEELLDHQFDLVYRTFLRQDRLDYELHFVYACKAEVSGIARSTLTNESTIVNFNLKIRTKPQSAIEPGFRRVSHLIVRTDDTDAEALKELESILYGEEPRIPSLAEVIEILESHASLRITNHGDGTWTATELKPIGAIRMLSKDEFSIDWHTSRYLNIDTYQIHSG